MTTTLNEITQQLADVRQDAETLARLQAAPKKVAQLEAALATAQAAHDAEQERQALIDREASYGGITDIRVDEVVSDRNPHSLLHSAFEVTYTKPSFHPITGKTRPAEHVVRGFAALPREALLYLLEKRPEALPAKIAALAPSDEPGLALSRYMAALRRGYL